MEETQESRVRSLGWEDPLEDEMQPLQAFSPTTPRAGPQRVPGRQESQGCGRAWGLLEKTDRSATGSWQQGESHQLVPGGGGAPMGPITQAGGGKAL